MLKIGFHRFGLDKPTINAWFGGMYRSFFQALEHLGCRVSYTDDKPDNNLDVLVMPMGGGQDKGSIRAMSYYTGPVILNIGAAGYWFRKGLLERWKDRILFLYGTDRSDYSYTMARSVNLPYHNMPFASNPDIMRPLDLPRLYDIVFVGNADSGIGRHAYIKPLLDNVKDKKVFFCGSGWERYGFPFQTIEWGDMLNVIYNLSSICINLSNDEQKGSGHKLQMDANNRLFDLAMAGCFQISNAPELVKHYFNDSEVVAIDSPEKWVSAIGYYLNHPEEMEPFRQASRKRAVKDHDWSNRAQSFLNEIEMQLSQWENGHKYHSSRLQKIIRFKDAFV